MSANNNNKTAHQIVEECTVRKNNLLSRLSSFLPQIRASNEELLEKINDQEQEKQPNENPEESNNNKRRKLFNPIVDSDLIEINNDNNNDEEDDENDSDRSGSDSDEDDNDNEDDTVPVENKMDNKQSNKKHQPSVVLDFAVGEMDTNPIIELLADNDPNDDSSDNDDESDENNKHVVSNDVIKNMLHSDDNNQTTIRTLRQISKTKPKGPLITELN